MTLLIEYGLKYLKIIIFSSVNHSDFMASNIKNLKSADLIIFTGEIDIILNKNNDDKIREQIEDKLMDSALEQRKQ